MCNLELQDTHEWHGPYTSVAEAKLAYVTLTNGRVAAAIDTPAGIILRASSSTKWSDE